MGEGSADGGNDLSDRHGDGMTLSFRNALSLYLTVRRAHLGMDVG